MKHDEVFISRMCTGSMSLRHILVSKLRAIEMIALFDPFTMAKTAL